MKYSVIIISSFKDDTATWNKCSCLCVSLRRKHWGCVCLHECISVCAVSFIALARASFGLLHSSNYWFISSALCPTHIINNMETRGKSLIGCWWSTVCKAQNSTVEKLKYYTDFLRSFYELMWQTWWQTVAPVFTQQCLLSFWVMPLTTRPNIHSTVLLALCLVSTVSTGNCSAL